ncbi:hypothetical protein HMPREF0322_02620 [Desulfitobacterium hafniense DP7]|uniref:Uncharacterized protein n=1 Tax=Desulfitobacterium hafniense DP7 TaxID=537010 RepID=G9XNS5_DESHA|nr:hypothetical protein [Desulfitobacterium hafniense]EHL06571.1 hypothetical protein HMPREF0322_02620 [Desulfitobacterium hafniense DP7]
MVERLWELFEELLEVILSSMAKHGFVDLLEFEYIKGLFEDLLLHNQLKALEKAG